MATFLQDEERPLLCVATDQVEDHIDLLSQNLLELRLAVIDNLGGSDGVEVCLIVAACGDNDGGTGMRRQLHRIGTHCAGTSMDQDRLSLFQVTVGKDSLPRSLGGYRHGCRFLKGEVGWFPCDDRRLDCQILRVGAPHSVGTEHGITWRIPRNVTANLFDEPRKLMTRYPRQVDREYLSCRSGGLNKIQMIDGGTLDLHQDLVACDRRRRYIVEHQLPTVFQQSDSFHASSPCVCPVRATRAGAHGFSFQRPFGRAWRRAQSGSFVSARPNSRSRPAMSAL